MPRARHLGGALLLATSCWLALAATGCVESPQEPVSYPAVARGRGATAVAGRWSITLTRAQVALGPFYFCAAASGSSTLCESSIAELRRVTVVDALAGADAPLGSVEGFSGVVKSAAYDFGISWFDTQTQATPAPALPGGHSMRLEGRATRLDDASSSLSFTADVDLVPQYQGQNAIPTAPAEASVTSSDVRLAIEVDPASWLRQVDFDAVLARGETSLSIAPGTAEHNALLLGIKNLTPPALRWEKTR